MYSDLEKEKNVCKWEIFGENQTWKYINLLSSNAPEATKKERI